MTITFLGTGSAIPIPRVKTDGSLHDCPQCRSTDPRDRRRPSSLLINKKLLIDAPPPIAGLLRSVSVKPKDIESVILTHRHRDAAGGLRALPKGIRRVFLRSPGRFTVAGHQFEAVQVPHDNRTWGYIVDGTLAYFSDYADIRPALPALKRAKVAILDGSGWGKAFPTHQPMAEVIPIVKTLSNLQAIYFTHVGHTHLPHTALEQKTRELGDDRFQIAYHGRRLTA